MLNYNKSKLNQEVFNTAVKDGRYISIDEFGAGVGSKCGCICPECGQIVLSNVTAKAQKLLKRRFTNHFSHANDSNCSGGVGETKIHLFAKHVLDQNRSISVPDHSKTKVLDYQETIVEKIITAGCRWRPDIALVHESGRKTFVEITVTSPVVSEKAKFYKDERLECLEIDLNYYYGKDLNLLVAEIERDIVKEIRKKNWVWSNSTKTESAGESQTGNSGQVYLGVAGVALTLFIIFRKSILKWIRRLIRI